MELEEFTQPAVPLKKIETTDSKTTADTINKRVGVLGSALRKITQKGTTQDIPVPYLHKDDTGLAYRFNEISQALEQQESNSKTKIGFVVGTGALLSVIPSVEQDIWIVADMNSFVLAWSRLTLTSIRTATTRDEYIKMVYNSELAKQAKEKNINPNEWLELEKRSLGNSHFLASEDNFQKSKKAVQSTSFVFTHGNLANAEYMNALSEAIESVDGQIRFANLTDVLEFSPQISDCIKKLPFHNQAAIAWATRNYTQNNHPSSRFSVGITTYVEDAVTEKNLFYQQWNSRR